MMEINYLAVLAAAVFSLVLGAIWYGPIFGKTWLKIVGATEMDLAAREEMKKKAMPLYALQFVLTLVQVYVLANLVTVLPFSALETALWAFIGFVVPIIAAGSMWNNDSRQIAWSRFLIQSGYYLILFISFGLILTWWV